MIAVIYLERDTSDLEKPVKFTVEHLYITIERYTNQGQK